jgi:hypothetical protein
MLTGIGLLAAYAASVAWGHLRGEATSSFLSVPAEALHTTTSRAHG